MQKEWFESKVTYEKVLEDGKVKKNVEVFLVDAVNFSEAEERVHKEVQSFISGEFKVEAVKRENISELFKSEDGNGYWYKAKVSMVSIDEIGKEKKQNFIMYVQAESFEVVYPRLKECLQDTMSDYVVTTISETKVLDIFEYKPNV